MQVDDAVIPLPAGDNAALYFTIRNEGDPVELVALRSAAAPTLVVHETTMEDGLLGMREVEGPLVLHTGTTSLEPGGLHVMLVGVDELTVGEAVPVDVELGDGSVLRFEADVIDVADAVHENGGPLPARLRSGPHARRPGDTDHVSAAGWQVASRAAMLEPHRSEVRP